MDQVRSWGKNKQGTDKGKLFRTTVGKKNVLIDLFYMKKWVSVTKISLIASRKQLRHIQPTFSHSVQKDLIIDLSNVSTYPDTFIFTIIPKSIYLVKPK